MSENGADFPKQDHHTSQSRRNVLKVLAAGAGIAAVGKLRTAFFHDHQESKQPKIVNTVQPNQQLNPDQSLTSPTPISDYAPKNSNVEKTYQQAFKKTESEILAIPPFDSVGNITNERAFAESKYVGMSGSLEDIDGMLRVCVTPDLRKHLINLRYKIRSGQSLEKAHLNDLTQKQKQWADSEGIPYEILALCYDNYDRAAAAIEQAKQDLPIPDNVPAKEAMLNIGGVAELIMQETAGFTQIGTGIAEKEINTAQNAFPTGIKDLLYVLQKVSDTTGIQYKPETTVGSVRGDPKINLSGGAIGPQIMPDYARKIVDIMTRDGKAFNPWDVNDATVAVWLFLAMKTYHKVAGDPKEQEQVIKSWNSYPPEVKAIFSAAQDYEKKFGIAA